MERSLGGDLSGVRIHTGSEAAASAARLGAKAYTVGNDVVFGSGAYAPGTSSGRRTLAHELAHVHQQRGAPIAGTAVPLGERGDRFEHQAEAAAERALRPAAAPRRHSWLRVPSARVQRQDAGTEPVPQAEPQQAGGANPAKKLCGPKIDSQLTAVLTKIQTDFRDPGLSNWRKELACDNLTTPTPGAIMAWDILELYLPHTSWLRGGTCGVPRTAGAIEDPAGCGNSVEVDGKCWLAGTVNYATYGVMCKLCSDRHRASYAPNFADQWTLTAMQTLVKAYNVADTVGGGIDPPLQWATATYNGGPSGRPGRAGNRDSCPVGCKAAPGVSSFDYAWPPIHGDFFH
jgi:Domain of unknown function (DUF4157)